jgi:hypothetical protein
MGWIGIIDQWLKLMEEFEPSGRPPDGGTYGHGGNPQRPGKQMFQGTTDFRQGKILLSE